MPVASPNVLIVEGQDDKYAVEKLLTKHELPRCFEILPKGGFADLRKSIRPEINASGRRTLGIISDANDDPAARWRSLRDALHDAHCTAVPQTTPPDGALLAGPRDIRVGVWLMPDNARPGELEDFIADLVPRDDPLWPVAQRYIDDIPADLQKFADRKRTRAYVHAWLATRDAPRPMGSAITAGDLDHNAPAAQPLIAWLRRLFSP